MIFIKLFNTNKKSIKSGSFIIYYFDKRTKNNLLMTLTPDWMDMLVWKVILKVLLSDISNAFLVQKHRTDWDEYFSTSLFTLLLEFEWIKILNSCSRLQIYFEEIKHFKYFYENECMKNRTKTVAPCSNLVSSCLLFTKSIIFCVVIVKMKINVDS